MTTSLSKEELADIEADNADRMEEILAECGQVLMPFNREYEVIIFIIIYYYIYIKLIIIILINRN